MKKIITALDPIDSPWPVIRFATHFAKNYSASIHLVFLVLPQADLDYSYPFPNDLSIAEEIPDQKKISESNDQLIEDSTSLFRQECESSGINFSFNKKVSAEELIKKTADADILIADKGANFLQKVLPHLHCPAIVANEDNLPEQAVLMFNNSTSSKFAIDSYISLLPEFKNLATYLLSINPDEEKENESYLPKLKSSFTDISYKSLHGNEEQKTSDFLSGLSGRVLVVMGAFGRSGISRFFHKSLANSVVKEDNVSLFIAHK